MKITIECREEREPDLYIVMNWLKNSGIVERSAVKSALMNTYLVEAMLDGQLPPAEILDRISLTRCAITRFLNDLDRIERNMTGKLSNPQPVMAAPQRNGIVTQPVGVPGAVHEEPEDNY